MVFTAKKVETPGFGDKLKKMREGVGLSKQKAAQLLNFQIKFLDYLENNELQKLPGDVYVRGFLRKYAALLGVDSLVLLDEYEKESKITRHLQGDAGQSLPSLRSRRFIFTPKHISLALAALAMLLVVGYLFYELNFLISAPRLRVFEPSKDETVESQNLTVRGQSESGVKLTINGQTTYIDKDGNFNQPINLNQGLNTIKIEATNKFDKTSSVVRQIMVR